MRDDEDEEEEEEEARRQANSREGRSYEPSRESLTRAVGDTLSSLTRVRDID